MSKSDYCNIKTSVPWRSTDQWRDLRIWLLDNVNALDYDIYGVDVDNINNRVVFFAWEKDAFHFILRWS